jgi:hypothetical protein
MATAILAIGFLGLFATVLSAGKMASAAEDDGLAVTGLEQRIDELRLLDWRELTDGTGITAKVWTARPLALAGLSVSQEKLTISPADVPGAQTLNATWNGGANPETNFTQGTGLGEAGALKVVATLTWTGRRSQNAQTRSLVTVISRGGLSKSAAP